MLSRFAFALLAALCIQLVLGDLYVHYPPGSNDRNRERNENRNNGNRMFDSQNNAKGGYPYRGDPTKRATDDALVYYTGSVLRLEWTSQHGCGPNTNLRCDMIIQYSLDDGTLNTMMPALRDGYPNSATIVESDDNNPGYRRLEFSTTTCQGGDCIQQNQDGTNTIPSNGFPNDIANRKAFYYQGASGGVQFGMNEGIDTYQECQQTERNRGLYTADQNIGPRDARGTRQNPNGARSGLECPEERDYYPYWRFSQFADLAVLTSNASYCAYYQENSQNVLPRYFCDCGQAVLDANPAVSPYCNLNNNPAPNQGLIPITETACRLVNGTWRVDPRTALGLPKPDCQAHAFSRDNHLGNALAVNAEGQLEIDASGHPVTAHYDVVIPQSWSGYKVVLRFRYNISTWDYPGHEFSNDGDRFVFDASNNCPGGGSVAGAGDDGNGVDNGDFTQGSSQCFNNPALNPENIPLYNRPYVKLFDSPAPRLSIALNTHQSSRTFQDRSYVFRVGDRPSYVDSDATIYNLNFRGRRGNIVQCYPAVEYDFVPAHLTVEQGNWLHIQLHGSDFNTARNANNGEGWQYSDRTNIVQTRDPGTNFPVPPSRGTLFQSLDAARFWALLGQDPSQCTTFVAGQQNEQNSRSNCGKLNQAPNRFPQDPAQGLMQVNNAPGTYHYVSTRNNNFSNRSQKGSLTVVAGPSSNPAVVIAAVVGSVAFVGLAVAGVLFYGKKNPNSRAGALFNSVSGCAQRSTTSSTTAPEMEYQRHARA